jgi:hypothetical protein
MRPIEYLSVVVLMVEEQPLTVSPSSVDGEVNLWHKD